MKILYLSPFSKIRMDIPVSASSSAVNIPAGPAPMIMRSKSFGIRNPRFSQHTHGCLRSWLVTGAAGDRGRAVPKAPQPLNTASVTDHPSASHSHAGIKKAPHGGQIHVTYPLSYFTQKKSACQIRRDRRERRKAMRRKSVRRPFRPLVIANPFDFLYTINHM